MTFDQIKQDLLENPRFLRYNNQRLASKYKIEIKDALEIRKIVNGETGRVSRISAEYVKLAAEYGIKESEISGGWLKQKGEPSVNFSLKFTKEGKSELEVLKEVLGSYKSTHKPTKESDLRISYKNSEPNILVISLADFHIDKKDYIKEVDIDKKIEGYLDCLFNILVRSFNQAKIEKILFVAGNDFFNTDNLQGQTTHLTPQDNCISWDKAYEKGFDLLVRAINRLKEFCKELDIVLVNGNHSYTKEFYLLHALEVYFKEDKNIKFDKSSQERKVYTYGQVFFGLTHGNTKMSKLPLTFATEYYQQWGQCKFKEILLGDKHTDRNTSFVTKDEFNGVNVRIMPSLTSADHWHYENQFTGNLQRGLGIIYSPTQGKQAEIYYNL